MAVIRTHQVTLYGGCGSGLVLRPLTDEHLPLLYKWCADPEVLQWTEGGTDDRNLSYGPDTVRQIYGGVSQAAHCFLIEYGGAPIGECWLQQMNLPDVRAMYAHPLDVRRIDMAIGEKQYWNRGIGTEMVGMLADFAFCGERVDVLHCFCEDYNVRSCRMWEKHGFTRVLSEPLPQPQKGRWQYHYRLTRAEFTDRRRPAAAPGYVFRMPLNQLQPSQLWISRGKLALLGDWFDGSGPIDPIPIKRLDGRTITTDGHTRAVAAHLAGWADAPVYWDGDELDMGLYARCVRWCDEAGVRSPADLAGRIVPHADYQRLWLKKCMEAGA
ncbi:MAG: GNAT family N-acetyltransferase [Clostridiales bacterium]|nr:GNAT family N-acetyltransferase [Clostridiales bacterium]